MDWNAIAYACTLTAVIGLACVLYDGLSAARHRPPAVLAPPRAVGQRAIRPEHRPIPPAGHIDRRAA